MRLVPAPRGTGIVAAPVSKKIIQFAGVGDVFTSSRGATGTMENFAKATYNALSKTHSYLMPDLWDATVTEEHPFSKFNSQLITFEEKRGLY